MDKGYFNLTKEEENKYKLILGTPRGNMEYKFQFDEPFTDTGYDGKQHKVFFLTFIPPFFFELITYSS